MTAEEIKESINVKESQIREHKNFLSSKDYQTIREVQGGEPMPDSVKKACADARKEINRLQSEILELKSMTPDVEVMDGCHD